MAKAFSVLSWNIEHLKNKQPARITRIVNVLQAQKPDVFALYEVEGKDVFDDLASKMPSYTFHITEGPQTQEILVGVKHKPALFTQRLEFKAGNTFLRPGALLSLRVSGEDYVVVFLHLKSLRKPIGLGIRDDQLERIQHLKKKLDSNAPAGRKANLVAVGDLNTMGMDYRGKAHDIPPEAELDKLDKDLARKSVSMRRLSKTTPNTWNNGSKSTLSPSNLDHVVAANHLKFKPFNNKNPINENAASFQAGQSDVDVRGWVDEPNVNAQDKWIRDFSDHSFLFFEVEKV